MKIALRSITRARLGTSACVTVSLPSAYANDNS
jgi:hypothetical protein